MQIAHDGVILILLIMQTSALGALKKKFRRVSLERNKRVDITNIADAWP
jgi:hypothetical protein